MEGCYSGLRARVAEVAPNMKWTHCCIHRQSLASKPLPLDLKNVLDEAVKIVNFIKASDTKSRLFTLLCREMDSLHSTLLFHTEVRWLSRGKVLTRLFELRNEVSLFFEDHPCKNLVSRIHDFDWLQSLAYLSDIFSQINKLNLSLQMNCNIFQVSSKIEAMKKKIDFWVKCIEKGQTEVFETLYDFVHTSEINNS
uniref:Zinc finger BED domain-containing protein 5 n=1 Tax=Cacopsylla melanoneura TaxID=428564 RepID=A0A8D8TWW8_9HEMI